MAGSLAKEFVRMPVLMRWGLVVFALGGSLDLLYHSAPASWTPSVELCLGRDGLLAHLVTLLGMVVTMLGVFSGRSGPQARVIVSAP